MAENKAYSPDAQALSAALLSSSTVRRIGELHSLREKLHNGDCSPESASFILDLLFKTYPFYKDRLSRRAVLQCLQIIFSFPVTTEAFAPFITALKSEALKAGIAATNALVLIEWCSVLLQQFTARSDLWEKWGLDILMANAQALEICVGSEVRKSVKNSAVVASRRALRAVFTTETIRDEAIKAVVAKLTGRSVTPAVKHAVFLGLVSSVCVRIPGAKAVLEGLKKDIYGFYVREIIGSRGLVSPHVADSLHDFFANFTKADDLRTEVVPSVERALLRAPEVVLNDLISPFVRALPHDIDMSLILQGNLLKPLLANTKSTNANIRIGALSAFETIISHCRDSAILEQVAEEILSPLKTSKLSAADQRTLYARFLSAISASVALARKVPLGLAPMVAKEPNEAVIGAASKAFANNLAYGLVNGIEPEKLVLDVVVKSLGDKRSSVRRVWLLRIGGIFWNLTEDDLARREVVQFADATIDKLLEAWNEVVASPLPAVQSGIATAGYVVASVCLSKFEHLKSDKVAGVLQKTQFSKTALAAGLKPSFLFNHRIYSKLNSDDDHIWAIRTLAVLSTGLTGDQSSSQVGDAWAVAFFFFICASNVKPSVKNQAVNALAKCYVRDPAKIGRIVVSALWQWWRQVELQYKDSASGLAKTRNNLLFQVVRSICLPPEEAERLGGRVEENVMKDQLISMVVLCRPELLPGVSWIETCQHAGIDPGALAREEPQKLLFQVNVITQLSGRENADASQSTPLRNAAYDAAAELAFVAPEVITPLLIKQFQADLDHKRLANIGPTEAAIFRTPEGTVVIDVLAKGGQSQVPNKNIKDYDTLKWEEELRTQLAQKKGQERTLTADEQAKVKAQLVKESAIRRELIDTEIRLRRGVGIIKSLATGPPTEAEMWMSPAVAALLQIISGGAGLLIGDAASTAFLACSERVSPRLGSSRIFIGTATLRALGTSQLPPEFEEEPLGDLVTRVLYRLRFTGEQRPLDSVSLAYILPLVFRVLSQGGVGRESVEEIDEQIILALEFLSSHTGSCGDTRLPRGEILSILISSMQKYNQHYKIIKDCLLDICRCLAPNISLEEISILLRGAIVLEAAVRTSVLQAINNAELDLTDLDFSDELWVACHDDVDENIELARTIWEENALEAGEDSASKMLPHLESPDKQLRRAAARSLGESVKIHRSSFASTLANLEETYREKAKPRMPQYDEYGMLKKVDLKDPWEARNGVALAFKELTKIFDEGHLVPFIGFLIEDGPLGDANPNVRDEMIEAATTIISIHGKSKVEELMKTFELSLEAPDKGSEAHDWVNEAIIILYGALARHLKVGDERLPKVVQRLLVTLSTPSESVQYAVAECLPPLIRASKEKTSDFVQQMLDQLFQSKKYAARRGAAYGLAGIVSGKGISTFREYRIMSTLKSAAENKKEVNYRQGALFAYELLSLILGRIFEPYVIQIVPQLLSSFGDSSADVREACLDAAKACFASLSSYGVKQILPTLLEGLDDPQWRSKKGACDLLGAMAYLDPQQLAQSLPEIIPPLTNVLNDSHKEVRASANRSLQRFGEVISNPEIKGLVGILLKALSDPTKYTDDALDSLIKVSFVHYLDSPSLALVVRILERGLGDRSATKRKSAQIIGSLAHLTERKDLISHLPILVAGLKLAIVDPVPTTRATASKALGSLVEKLGEEALPDLIPGLMLTLKSDTSAGDRLGSAQALSEVLAGLGTTRLEETLPTILQNVGSAKPAVREGFMSLFIFLPACFGNSFAAYLSKIIPPILSGLADDVESIRETSLRAGRLLVKNFATRAIDLLLPELERGLADDSHRIRLSSVELVGDLLFNLTGISSKAEQDEVEEGAGAAGQSLLEVLGEERRNKVLSALYICRNDTSGLVRSAAINVWKALVASPRTLKELIPTLSQLIIRRLASSNMEQKVIAGNALGELIRKAGEGVLSTLLPILEEGLQTSTDTDAKQGICIALRELISSASTDALEDYEKTLISVVRTALVDPDDDVREAAAEAFDSFQKIFGKRAVDQVLPHLLSLLQTEYEAENALAALLTLLTENTRANIILPNLIPTLLASPITSFNAKALGSLAQVAGPTLNRRLPNILSSLMDNIVACKDEERLEYLNNAFDAVLSSMDEFDGLNSAMSVMLALIKHDDHKKRAAADRHLARFFRDGDIDYSRYTPDLIRALLISFDDRDPEVVKAAWTALSELTKKLRKEEMESLAIPTRQVLLTVGVAGSNLPGFSLPKGINAILPIFLQGLMNGTTEQRTQSALAISDIIDRTSTDALRPFVTQITGPLIRVVSERSVEVKAAILLTLNNLLEKIPTFLKPFLPQLQRTFAKSLADTSSEILRTRAAKALGTLITLTPRIDPLIAELVAGAKTTDMGVKSAMLKALYEVVSKVGTNMGDASSSSVLALVSSEADEDEDSMAIASARLLGALLKNLPPENANGLIRNRALNTSFTKSSVLGLNAILLESPGLLCEPPFMEETASLIYQGIAHRNPFVSDNCVLAAGKYLLAEAGSKSFETTKPIFEALASAIQPGAPVDTRRLALVVIRTVSRLHIGLVKPHLPLLAPKIFASVRDPVIPVKLSAEAAFIALFSVVDHEGAVFEKYLASPGGTELPPTVKRSMQDYFRRVALRLGAQARERREAEGGQGSLGLGSDEAEDEREIWSVGKVELGDIQFGGD